ncbi:MAG: DPP IV N-terminal domain-containing protein [Vulcanimicrobiota bacterium]
MNVQPYPSAGGKKSSRRAAKSSKSHPKKPSTPPKSDPASRPTFAEPSLSPDGKELVFVSGGDIWTAPSQGGEARLLLSDPATESRPLFSPDGQQLAFVSNRSGHANVYTLAVDTGQVKRLTYSDSNDSLEAWSPDGKYLYFSNGSQDIEGCRDIFRIPSGGGTPMPVSADRFTDEYFAAPSPTGEGLAFTGHGTGTHQWWRNGHSNLDRSQIYLHQDGDYQQLTDGDSKDMWPMWSPDGQNLYFVSDRSGTENIWVRSMEDDNPRQLTHFNAGRVLWPSIASDGKSIVFERDSKLYCMNTKSGRSHEVPITRRGAPASVAPERRDLSGELDSFTLSPDGKKVAFLAHGEVFAAPAGKGGPIHRVTASAAEEFGLVWSPDSQKLAYVSQRDGERHLYLYDFLTSHETQLTSAKAGDGNACFSPDGKNLAFVRQGKTLCSLNLANGKEKVLAEGLFGQPPFDMGRPIAWSPDSRWVAYRSSDENAFNNAWIVPAKGGESRQVSFLPNTFGDTLSWSPNGKFLLLDSSQRTEKSVLTRVDLVAPHATFAEDDFAALFKPEEAASKEPLTVEIDFAGVRERQRVGNLPIDIQSQTISPDGKLALLHGLSGGQSNLFLLPLEGDHRELVQLTSSPGWKQDAQFSPDQKQVYYRENGVIKTVSVEDRSTRTLDLSATIEVDFAKEKQAAFEQAWSYLRDQFYDPGMHGLDWEGLRNHYQPLITGAANPDEMRRQLALMMGELNASHLGVGAPAGGGQVVGRTGLDFERGEYEDSGRFKVSGVLAEGPAGLAGVKVGDVLTAVNGEPLEATTNLDQVLSHQVGRKVALTLESQGDTKEVVVAPVTAGQERNLRYREWVDSNRQKVEELSGGRLGYVHIADMSSGALEQLYQDLDATNQAREGIVIDVRNNNGGFVNAYALDVFARKGYLSMTNRDTPTAPARRLLGQRSLELPTILLTNRQTLSDGEDFSEGYRALKLGKVVGEPTSGWILFTSGAELVDGTRIRLPFSEVLDHRGQPMEMNPRPVDVAVDRPLGESYTDRDVQLETAVSELLSQMDATKDA